MSQRMSTAGLSLSYAVETTAGTMPTTGYTVIPEIKTMPSLNEAPNTIDSTTLSETESQTSVAGLKSNSVKEYGANLTDDLLDKWDALYSAYETAAAAGKAVWFATSHPKLQKAVYYTGEPSKILPNDAAVDGMYETTMYITPTSAPKWGEKPTIGT